MLTTYKSCFRCFAFRIKFGSQFLLSTQPESRLHCALLASWQNLSSDLERPLHKQISESICTSFREGYCRPNPFFKHHKAAASIKSSPSRTNTNLNTLQCSFPKTPLNTAFISPIPQNPSIPPNLLSHDRKSFGASAMAPARLRSLVGRAQRPFCVIMITEFQNS